MLEISAVFKAADNIGTQEVFELLGKLQLRLEREGLDVRVSLPLRDRKTHEPMDLDVRIIVMSGEVDLALILATAEEFAPRGCPVTVKKLETEPPSGNVPTHEAPVLN